MHRCDICGKREWRVAMSMFGYDTSKHDKLFDKNLFVCYECLCDFFASILRRVKQERPQKQSRQKGHVIPSLPWAMRQRMGKISKDELIDINLWINKIKNIKDFKEEK